VKYNEIINYWDERAKTNGGENSTTDDKFLRTIELRVLLDALKELENKHVGDFGCGDGKITLELSKEFPMKTFMGLDYSKNMIMNANKLLGSSNVKNLFFKEFDIMEKQDSKFDVIYTTRCLINLPTWELQKKAILNIHSLLFDNGVYIMIENFKEGHNNLNEIRQQYGLSEISIRDHNLFFERSKLLEFLEELFEIEQEINISSSYYLISRVIYSKICHDAGIMPDYNDDHHRYGAALPFTGEFGPVRFLLLRRRS
jgi:ubiquinone/menaquinone biosynthesis C-methylase UbiE